MRITMLWPFGRYQPGDVVDVDPRIASVMTAEAFARSAGTPEAPKAPRSATLADLQAYAAANGCTLHEARDRIAAEREAPRSGPLAQPANQEAPPCA
jgi:hypothetical protein